MKKLLMLSSILLTLGACTSTEKKVEDQVVQNVVEREDTVFTDGNLIFAEGVNWYAATDDFGSSHNSDGESIDISNGEIKVEFDMYKKQEGMNWPFVELVSETGRELSGAETITIEYKSTHDLKIKLSQTDFGPEGDGSYAHYETKIPMAADWAKVTVILDEFNQPSWAPNIIPLNLDNVQNIYLVPAIDATIGGKATLEVRLLEIN